MFTLRQTSTRLFALLPALLISGCSGVGYYAQSIGGHLDLMSRARPISEVLADPALSEDARQRLELSQRLRRFAVAELALPDNASYTRYADLRRSRVVWNVVATDEFSVHPDKSCFLVVGCLSYRGYFDHADAEAYAAKLRRQDKDVSVTGATAYSTLGWFADPLLNTMLQRADPDMAEVLFHELAHQRLYIDDDSSFNEAFATAVAHYGVRRWYESRDDAAGYLDYATGHQRRQQFYGLLVDTRRRLAKLYAQPLPAARKRAAKKALFEGLQRDYAKLKEEWGGYDAYDRYMAQPLNNAHLALIATYHELVPAFLALIDHYGGDLRAFYAEAERLGRLPRPTRRSHLVKWLPEPEEATTVVAGD